METKSATQLLRSLSAAEIRKRLDVLDGERQALLTLLRATSRLERTAKQRKTGEQ